MLSLNRQKIVDRKRVFAFLLVVKIEANFMKTSKERKEIELGKSSNLQTDIFLHFHLKYFIKIFSF